MPRTGTTRRNALIVEDDLFVSELGAAMLAEFDLAVVQVRSAEEALDHLTRDGARIDVLVADIQLAGSMDGVALARSVRTLWPLISVIVTSGHVSPPADDLPDDVVFVPKPWRPLDIVAAAERASRLDHSVHAIRF